MLTIAPQPPTLPRRRRSGAKTRRRILTAALELFAEEGFGRTTVRQIARRAGITDAAIYYHFPTKADVLHELINTGLLPSPTPHDESPGVRETMRDLAAETMQAVRKNGGLLKLILREALAGDAAAVARYHLLLDAWEGRAVDRLGWFETKDQLRPGTARLLARQIIYAVIMSMEDMLLLRLNPALSAPQRRARAQQSVGRYVDRLLSEHRAVPSANS